MRGVDVHSPRVKQKIWLGSLFSNQVDESNIPNDVNESDVYVEGYFKLNEGESRKISINTADAKELQAHPYIDWSVANSIVKIRNQKENKYKSIEEIKVSVLIDEELFEKIKPYLSL
jgi:DNA uptake protein ComE-like DNA-binding protein